MTCDLTNPIFTNEAAAVAHLEAGRWADGVICPLCGVADEAKKMGGRRQAGMSLQRLPGQIHGSHGTIYERSHIPLHKWLLATHLMASSKKGISAHQLRRMLGITYKSAWFMSHRIREGNAPPDGESGPIGGKGKIVEADETYIGNSQGQKEARRRWRLMATRLPVLSLTERGGEIRSARLTKRPRARKFKAIRDNVIPKVRCTRMALRSTNSRARSRT